MAACIIREGNPWRCYYSNIPSKARIMTITAAQKDGTTMALHVMVVSMEPHDARVN